MRYRPLRTFLRSSASWRFWRRFCPPAAEIFFPAATTAIAGKRNWAIIVGISNYQSPGLNLAGRRDARFYDAPHSGKGWDPDNHAVDERFATREGSVLGCCFSLSGRCHDNVVFYSSAAGSYGP
jgi:hypothetical protein